MASFPRWFDKAKATSARLITCDVSDGPDSLNHQRKRESEYSDIPPFLLPLSVRVRLDKDRRKSRNRVTPYDKIAKRKHKLKMPTVLKRLAGPPTCPIVVAQYKDEYRGVGHESDLHWALVVITDRDTLSGPSFQAYSLRRRLCRPSGSSRPPASQRRTTGRPSTAATTGGATTIAGPSSSEGSPLTAHGTSTAWFGSGTNAIRSELNSSLPSPSSNEDSQDPYEYETQWYTRHAPASLYDVSATVRSLCLGGVQVGSVRRADIEKLVEYLRSHPPVPAHRDWSSRDYVLELLELLRPFKMLRSDLQAIHLRAREGDRREVCVDDLLDDLREVGHATQQSIFMEEFRPCVKYAT